MTHFKAALFQWTVISSTLSFTTTDIDKFCEGSDVWKPSLILTQGLSDMIRSDPQVNQKLLPYLMDHDWLREWCDLVVSLPGYDPEQEPVRVKRSFGSGTLPYGVFIIDFLTEFSVSRVSVILSASEHLSVTRVKLTRLMKQMFQRTIPIGIEVANVSDMSTFPTKQTKSAYIFMSKDETLLEKVKNM